MQTKPKRVTVNLDPQLHRALSVKAAATHQSLSTIVNEAVPRALAEDAADLAAFEERAKEPNLTFRVSRKTHRWHIGHINKGLRQAQAGKLAGEEDVAKALGRWHR